jgi:hypothetical protein
MAAEMMNRYIIYFVCGFEPLNSLLKNFVVNFPLIFV